MSVGHCFRVAVYHMKRLNTNSRTYIRFMDTLNQIHLRYDGLSNSSVLIAGSILT